jgi:hypothetical protein
VWLWRSRHDLQRISILRPRAAGCHRQSHPELAVHRTDTILPILGRGHHGPDRRRRARFPGRDAGDLTDEAECLTLKNEPDTFPQLLLLLEFAHDPADRIYHSIVTAYDGEPTLKPTLRRHDHTGSTRWVDFDTIKPVWPTRAGKSHVSHVVADTGSWEQKLAQELDEITSYVKNQGLNFTIPYTLNGDERQYYPDCLARVGSDLTLVIEVSGEAAKTRQPRSLPHGRCGYRR